MMAEPMTMLVVEGEGEEGMFCISENDEDKENAQIHVKEEREVRKGRIKKNKSSIRH